MTVLILGASSKPNRYSYLALNDLRNYGHQVIAVGLKSAQVNDIQIQTELPDVETPIDTVTIYLNKNNQVKYEKYILELQPRRVIFNPGAENSDLMKRLADLNIETLNACTLVMLRTSQF